MKTLFKIFILFLIAFPALCLADSEREDFPAVVKLTAKEMQGTGFFVASDKINSKKSNIVVTNFHIIGSTNRIEEILVQAPSGEWRPVKSILALSALNDLAVLEVDYESEHYYLLDHSIDSVQEVETAGFPVGEFQHNPGQILSVDLVDGNQYMIFQKPIKAGSSGSPVFKEDKLIAVLKKTLPRMSTGTPFSLLKELLAKPPLHCQSRSCIENEIKKLHQLAEQGDSRVQYQLASAYLQGHVVEQNFNKAFYWYKQAAEQGHPGAQYQLAAMYYHRIGVEQNLKTAFQWYKLAAEQGHPGAQYQLAFMYYNGEGVEQNPEQALYWLKKAAELGHPIAQFRLAEMHHYGEGVEQNPERALYWLKKAAEQGHSSAQYQLADMYYKGVGVEQNPEQALYWYMRAAEQGHPGAQYQLANMYYYGLGVKADFKKAVEFYTLVAEQGYFEAQFRLAYMYDKGEGVEQNPEQALYWYTKAAEQGHPEAHHNLNALLQKRMEQSQKRSETQSGADFLRNEQNNEKRMD